MQTLNTPIKEEDQLSQQFQSIFLQPAEDSQEHNILLLIAMGRSPFLVQEGPASPSQNDISQREQIQQKILSYNRKDKSLEELSRKFIENFEGKDGIILQLDKVTVQLNVERRRIYDIVNIFESLQVVKKAAKNNYFWRGLKEAINTIDIFATQGPDSPSFSRKKEKSLQNLAARFLQLFIHSKHPLSLEQAASQLIVTQDFSLVKTKIRRLYDIVNVFKSIGLVQKLQLGSKKTAFKWMGTRILEDIIASKSQNFAVRTEEIAECKENNSFLSNNFNFCSTLNNWYQVNARSVLGERSFMKQFSQKVFYPAIIQQRSGLTLPCSQEIASDVFGQY